MDDFPYGLFGLSPPMHLPTLSIKDRGMPLGTQAPNPAKNKGVEMVHII